MSQASGAAAKALSLATRGEVEVPSAISWVDPEVCSGCQTCIGLCAYGAIGPRELKDKKGNLLATVAFTEEFFFRGFIQTRLRVLTGSSWSAIAIATILFSLYHLPYAMLNPRWPSAGSWSLALGAAFANGLPGGLVLGVLYARSGGNLIPCVVLHSMINAAPAMTVIRFGG